MGTRHVSGDPWPVEVDMAAATVCYKGDFIVQSLADPQIGFPASTTVLHETSLAVIQALAHTSFIGIALEDKVAGKAKAVQVATEGIFEIPITAAAAAVVGALFGPDNSDGPAGHTAIVDQRAILVATDTLAFGVLVQPTVAADTHAHIRIFGTKTTGGVKAMA